MYKLLRERGVMMTNKTRRSFTDDFKREAVSLLASSGRLWSRLRLG